MGWCLFLARMFSWGCTVLWVFGAGTAAWISSMRTMRCWSLVSADVVTLSPPQVASWLLKHLYILYQFGKEIYWESRSEGRMEKAQAVLFVRSVISPVSDSRSSRRLYIYLHDKFLKVQSVTLSFLTLCVISHESYLSNLWSYASSEAVGGRMWPGCLVQEQEGRCMVWSTWRKHAPHARHEFIDLLLWCQTLFQEKPRS